MFGRHTDRSTFQVYDSTGASESVQNVIVQSGSGECLQGAATAGPSSSDNSTAEAGPEANSTAPDAADAAANSTAPIDNGANSTTIEGDASANGTASANATAPTPISAVAGGNGFSIVWDAAAGVQIGGSAPPQDPALQDTAQDVEEVDDIVEPEHYAPPPAPA